MTFSIIMPMDTNRLDLFEVTFNKYKEFGIPEGTEFIIVSRTIKEEIPGTKLVTYEWNEETFNPSMAFNLGVKHAKNDYIIITCPEVMPSTNVLKQLSGKLGKNVLCQVYDENSSKELCMSLVNSSFRCSTPAMYFLALFNKKDIETINGWDEGFMKLYAWEDSDFGSRWVNAGLPFEVADEILAIHQYHPRIGSSTAYTNGQLLYEQNQRERVIRPKNGLVKE